VKTFPKITKCNSHYLDIVADGSCKCTVCR